MTPGAFPSLRTTGLLYASARVSAWTRALVPSRRTARRAFYLCGEPPMAFRALADSLCLQPRVGVPRAPRPPPRPAGASSHSGSSASLLTPRRGERAGHTHLRLWRICLKLHLEFDLGRPKLSGGARQEPSSTRHRLARKSRFGAAQGVQGLPDLGSLSPEMRNARPLFCS